jgi:peroxiredoxin
MVIEVGDRLPSAKLLHKGEDGFEEVDLRERLAGRKVVLFGLPGAYTSTCTSAHLPSFIRTIDKFGEKGIDEVICFAVNDVHVMAHWGQTTGATDAGITMLADWDSSFTKSLGLEYSAPPVGFKDRCRRCAMIADDGVVTILQIEEERGVCVMTAGETLLEMV